MFGLREAGVSLQQTKSKRNIIRLEPVTMLGDLRWEI